MKQIRTPSHTDIAVKFKLTPIWIRVTRTKV